jgi:hypothetical protein
MRKVIFRIDRPRYQLQLLSESDRSYENFKISPHGYYEKLSEVLNNFNVRNIWMNETCDKEVDHNEYVKFMKSFAGTIEYLQTGDIATKNLNRVTKIDFPKLTKLHCSFTNRSAFSIFLGENKKLDSVILSCELDSSVDEFIIHNNVISEFLIKNYQIKNLWLLHLENLFIYDISAKVTQKLKHLTFTAYFQYSPQHAKENFLKFIKAQRCLQELNIMGCREKRILANIWNDSVKFAKLFIIDCNFYEELQMNDLYENPNVEEIDFYLTSSMHALCFLQVSPNIVKYKIRQLSKQLLEFSVHKLKRLREIRFQSVDSDAISYFNRLDTKFQHTLKLRELDFFEYVNIDKN